MRIEYDAEKHAETLLKRGLDFEDAPEVLGGRVHTLVDDRGNYGEVRFQTYGILAGRLIQLVWTWRGDVRRIIAMRNCNEREQARFGPILG